MYIRADEKPGEDPTEHDWNCTLPLPDDVLLQQLKIDNPQYFEKNPNITIPQLRYEGYYIPEAMRWTCVLTNDMIDRLLNFDSCEFKFHLKWFHMLLRLHPKFTGNYRNVINNSQI